MIELLMGGGPKKGDWEFVASAQSDDGNGDATVNFPSGYQAGDAVIALVYHYGELPSVEPPSGWQKLSGDVLANNGYQGYAVHVLPKITNQTSYQNSNLSGATLTTILLVVMRPTDVAVDAMTAGIINEFAVDTYTSGHPNPPALTTTTNRNRILALGMPWYDGSTLTPPSGYTILASYYTSSSDSPCFIALKDDLQEVAGSVDPGEFTVTWPDYWIALTLSLRTDVKSGYCSLSGSFASTYSDLVSGTEVIASPTSVTVSVEGPSAAISISGGTSAEYRINGGSWTSSPGTVVNGDVVEVRQTSQTVSSGASASSTATVTIGNKTATYTLTSRRELVLVGSSQNWTVPTGVTSISVVGTGAGGGGGGGDNYGIARYGGGGGGGGAMSITPSLAVSAGQVLEIVAGLGGSPGNNDTPVNGGTGGDSYIIRSGSTLWRAKGGSGGVTANNSTGSGGAGGSATNSVGTTKYSGGSGGNGASNGDFSDWGGGGGGGAGGYSANGGKGAAGSGSGTNYSSAASGGAASGGASCSGGGGTGVSGAGTSGGATSSVATGGREGSPDAYASNGGAKSNGSSPGGTSGGGGGGGEEGTNNGGRGGNGAVRIVW